MSRLFDLTGKKALVTGGGRGIGRAMAVELAKQGADVTLWSRTQADLDETAQIIKDLGRNVWVQSIDISDIAAVQEATLIAHKNMSSIDILCNNAGFNIRQKPQDVTEEAYDAIMAINLKGAFFVAQAVGRIMIEQKSGKIINTSSQSAKQAMYDRIIYSATKAALDQMTKCMALEWAAYNIQVNALAPGFVETPMTSQIMKDENFIKYWKSKVLADRFVRADEVAACAVYLASSASDMMTGQILYLDSGWGIH